MSDEQFPTPAQKKRLNERARKALRRVKSDLDKLMADMQKAGLDSEWQRASSMEIVSRLAKHLHNVFPCSPGKMWVNGYNDMIRHLNESRKDLEDLN